MNVRKHSLSINALLGREPKNIDIFRKLSFSARMNEEIFYSKQGSYARPNICVNCWVKFWCLIHPFWHGFSEKHHFCKKLCFSAFWSLRWFLFEDGFWACTQMFSWCGSCQIIFLMQNCEHKNYPENIFLYRGIKAYLFSKST